MGGMVDVEKIFRTDSRDNLYTVQFEQVVSSGVEVLNKINEIGSYDGHRNFIFGEIKKVITHDDKLFVLDTRDRRIKIYNMEGEWLANYDISGSGPGESMTPVDMDLDKLTNELLILDNFGKIMKLSIESGSVVV
jgi:hypothetical protein